MTVAHRSRSMFGNIGRIIEIVDRTLYIANDIDSFQRGSVHVFFLSLKSWFTSWKLRRWKRRMMKREGKKRRFFFASFNFDSYFVPFFK